MTVRDAPTFRFNRHFPRLGLIAARPFLFYIGSVVFIRRILFMISLFSRKKNVREDGEVTRRHILETAVRLFAEHGYADTTSKMICKEAGVNIAAVNYHFGSRDDLYRAVLEDVHEHIVNEREMEAIMNAGCSAEERLAMVLDAYIANIYNSQSWHSRIWAHELIAPSALGGLSFLQGTLTKERSISKLLSEITGIPMGDPALHCCVITVMSPYLIMLCVQRDMARKLAPIFHYRGEDMNVYFKDMIFSGLHSFAERYRRGELPSAMELPEELPEEAESAESPQN